MGLVIEHPERGVLTGLWPFGTQALGMRYRTTWDPDRRRARVWPSHKAVEAALTLMPGNMREDCYVLRYRRRSWYRQPIVEEVVD